MQKRIHEIEYLPQLPDLGGWQDLADHVRAPRRVVGLDYATSRNQQLSERRHRYRKMPVEVRNHPLEQTAIRPYRAGVISVVRQGGGTWYINS